MTKFTIYQKTEYEITAESPEEAYGKWMDSNWDWSLEEEPETCSVYDSNGVEVWRP